MGEIEAIYRRGAFQPVGPVNLRENDRVKLRIELSRPVDETEAALDWLKEAEALQAAIRERRGCDLPDSSVEIAADRAR
jgi:predicted DNA-binding antitoxin AbrB/MazE fold protein